MLDRMRPFLKRGKMVVLTGLTPQVSMKRLKWCELRSRFQYERDYIWTASCPDRVFFSYWKGHRLKAGPCFLQTETSLSMYNIIMVLTFNIGSPSLSAGFDPRGGGRRTAPYPSAPARRSTWRRAPSSKVARWQNLIPSFQYFVFETSW